MNNKKNNRYQALLLDLDGTLIDLAIEQFVPAYLQVLSHRFADLSKASDFTSQLFRATYIMLQNEDPTKTNEAVFYEEFCQLIEQPYEAIKPLVDHFYRYDFNKLSCWCRELPYAQAVIHAAREKDLTLVLATNPIFPATATCQRLSWGGLSESAFHLITTMENMHFCKPNPDYYLEIAHRIGYPPQQCLMAGNDTREDLNASAVGMDTFLVEDFIIHLDDDQPVSNYRGCLKDLATFIDKLE
ncbi:MAG TPA: HAD family hydrolase [Candidatus Limnocylindrales bacterium]|nr:HAD family hydrolase [Candidatus Limnocylindrales bacterium]